MVVSHLVLNTLLLTFMYQTPFWTLVLTRLPKNLIMLPIEILLLALTLNVCTRIKTARKSF